MVNELFMHAMTCEKGLTYVIIGPSRVQEKEIVWDDHVARILRELTKAKIPHKVNNTDLSISFPTYGKVVIDGADNIESLRGKSDWGGVALDEFAYWRNPSYAWEEVVEPNLIVNHAFAMISSTTNGYDYFHRLIKRGDQLNEIEGTAFNDEGAIVQPNSYYRSFRFTSYDNKHLDTAWLESKKLTMSPEAFNREYLARFEKFKGLIYKEFDRRVHILPTIEPNMGWRFYRAMDFGAVNATVCLWIGVDNSDNVYVFDEYYNNGSRTEFHANVISGKTDPNYPIQMTFGDPSGNQAMLDYASFNVIVTPATKIFTGGEMDWVNSGIEKVRQALKINPQTGKPRLFISQNCINTIREFESYHWMDKNTVGIQKDVPEKKDDHCMDALRYFMVSYETPSMSYEIDLPQKYNEFSGY